MAQPGCCSAPAYPPQRWDAKASRTYQRPAKRQNRYLGIPAGNGLAGCLADQSEKGRRAPAEQRREVSRDVRHPPAAGPNRRRCRFGALGPAQHLGSPPSPRKVVCRALPGHITHRPLMRRRGLDACGVTGQERRQRVPGAHDQVCVVVARVRFEYLQWFGQRDRGCSEVPEPLRDKHVAGILPPSRYRQPFAAFSASSSSSFRRQ